MTKRTPEERRARRAARKTARLAAAAAQQAQATPTKAELKREAELERALRAVAKPTGFTKATRPDAGGYAVFTNANRRSALRMPLTGSGMVDHIPMSEAQLSVETCAEMLFNTLWERADYDPKRAAAFYATAARWRGITEDAKTHLERLLGTPLKHLKPQQPRHQPRSSEMKSKRTSQTNEDLQRRTMISAEDVPQSEATAGTSSVPATAAAKPAAKAKAKPAAKAKAKPAAKAKAKPNAEPVGKRALLHARKVKVIISKNPKREGTTAWKKFEVYKTAKTVGEALEKGAKVGFKMSTINYDLKHKFIQLV